MTRSCATCNSRVLLAEPQAYPHIPKEEYPTFEDFDMNRDGLVTFQEWQEYLYQQQLAEKQAAQAGGARGAAPAKQNAAVSPTPTKNPALAFSVLGHGSLASASSSYNRCDRRGIWQPSTPSRKPAHLHFFCDPSRFITCTTRPLARKGSRPSMSSSKHSRGRTQRLSTGTKAPRLASSFWLRPLPSKPTIPSASELRESAKESLLFFGLQTPLICYSAAVFLF